MQLVSTCRISNLHNLHVAVYFKTINIHQLFCIQLVLVLCSQPLTSSHCAAPRSLHAMTSPNFEWEWVGGRCKLVMEPAAVSLGGGVVGLGDNIVDPAKAAA